MSRIGITSEDFHLIVQGLGHMTDCDCLTTEEALVVAELLKKIELMTRGERKIKELEHLEESFNVSDWDKEL